MKTGAIIAILLITAAVFVSAYFVWTKVIAPPSAAVPTTPEEKISDWVATSPTILVDNQPVPVSTAMADKEYTHITIRDAQGKIIAIVSMEELSNSIQTNQPLSVSRPRGGSSAPQTITINDRVISVSDIINLGEVPVNTQFKITDVVEEIGENSATATIEAYLDYRGEEGQAWLQIREYGFTVEASETRELLETISDQEYVPAYDNYFTFELGDRRDVYFYVLDDVFKVTIYNPTLPEHCYNDAWDDTESDLNCGDGCFRCPDASQEEGWYMCWENSDCYSDFCYGVTEDWPIQDPENSDVFYEDSDAIRTLAGQNWIGDYAGICVDPNDMQTN